MAELVGLWSLVFASDCQIVNRQSSIVNRQSSIVLTFKHLRGDQPVNLHVMHLREVLPHVVELVAILKIDPATGVVVGKADMSEITNRIKNNYPYAEFINGIAYDSSTKKVLITGKYWPEMYEIKFSE